MAANQNKVLSIVSPMTFGRNRVEENQPIGVFYLKKYAGVDPENGDALYFKKEGSDEKTNVIPKQKIWLWVIQIPNSMVDLKTTSFSKGSI
jgi:hypothetical protein